jgi:hypothetical protein
MRNFLRPLALPVILVGIRNADRTNFTQSLNRCEPKIRSRGEITFLGMSDIMVRINISKKSVKSILELSPDKFRYGTQLLYDANHRQRRLKNYIFCECLLPDSEGRRKHHRN